MMFSSISKREKNIIIAIIILAVFGVFWNFILEPCLKKWQDLDAQIAAKKVKLQKCVKSISDFQTKNAEYGKYASFVKGSKSDEQQLAVVLSEIDQLAKDSGVTLIILKPNSVKDVKIYKKFLAEAELDTTIKGLIKFLYQTENSNQMLKIENMDINATGQGQDSDIKVRVLISKILFKD